MLTFIYIMIFILGMLFGSFSSVIIDRMKHKKAGIINGRSECPVCKHRLKAIDLIPLFSFLSTKGKCRYCHTKISKIYPILELCMGSMFLLSSYFLVDFNLILNGSFVEIYKLIFVLLLSFFSIIYVFYDILYLEIPEIILIILNILTFITVSLQSIIPNFNIINLLPQNTLPLEQNLLIILLGLLSIVGLYIIMTKGLSEIYDFLILGSMFGVFFALKYYFQIPIETTAIGSASIGVFIVFMFLYLQIIISGGRWMGGGDLRIAILMGLIVGINFSLNCILLSYLSGSIIGIFIVIYAKTRQYYIAQKGFLSKFKKILGIKQKPVNFDTQIPFGPFLAVGIFGVLFYGPQINDFVQNIFIR